jgi:copper oxidase (laccase) domain-containing protein
VQAAAAPTLEWIEPVDGLEAQGFRAFTTTRAAGSFATVGAEPVGEVMARWRRVQAELAAGGPRFATSTQVHAATVLAHGTGWEGWLRAGAADGHFSADRGTGMAVTVADCVPVFITHPSGASALLHSGWRGTAARIVEQGIGCFTSRGLPARELYVHAGPAICGRCYEVSAEVYTELTGLGTDRPRTVDLRALVADHARAAGVRDVTVSARCTRCE